MREIVIAKDLDELSKLGAGRFVSLASAAISAGGRFSVALAGGSTPKALYRLLASEEFRSRVDWPRVYFFFGDERCVPPDHPESNFRMARENLFDLLGTSPKNIFKWRTEAGAAQLAADEYEETIRNFFPSAEGPDLVLLGIGADGHTASLFPYTEALTETARFAAPNWVEKLDTWRLTMTFTMLNGAANVLFLIAGEEKAPVLREILEGEFQPQKCPAQGVIPANGKLVFYIDKQAAALLSKR